MLIKHKRLKRPASFVQEVKQTPAVVAEPVKVEEVKEEIPVIAEEVAETPLVIKKIKKKSTVVLDDSSVFSE